MHPLLVSLSGGGRRSIGESNRVAQALLAQASLIGVLFEGLEYPDPVLRMRCADVIEKVSGKRPELLLPFKDALLYRLSKIEQKEVRWHVAPLLTRLPLTEAEEADAVNSLLGFLDDPSSIVKTLSMQALADIALRNRRWHDKIEPLLQTLSVTGTPAMKARGKKLLRLLTSSPAD